MTTTIIDTVQDLKMRLELFCRVRGGRPQEQVKKQYLLQKNETNKKYQGEKIHGKI